MTTWFITGCSTGLGRALAEAVLQRGDNAVVTARDTSKVEDLTADFPDTTLALSLDVTDTEQVRTAIERGTERFGEIDVDNNAGYGYRAAVEEGDDEDVRTRADVAGFRELAAGQQLRGELDEQLGFVLRRVFAQPLLRVGHSQASKPSSAALAAMASLMSQSDSVASAYGNNGNAGTCGLPGLRPAVPCRPCFGRPGCLLR